MNTGTCSVNRDVADALQSEAYISGRRAGAGLLSPSLNPHPPGTPEHLQWYQGWHSSTATKAQEALLENARFVARIHAPWPPCPYRSSVACDCGGRGLCLDVA